MSTFFTQDFSTREVFHASEQKPNKKSFFAIKSVFFSFLKLTVITLKTGIKCFFKLDAFTVFLSKRKSQASKEINKESEMINIIAVLVFAFALLSKKRVVPTHQGE